jgi:lipopolysaccharide/colanic/teichoic acid biosynthesis glycosyltransferase
VKTSRHYPKRLFDVALTLPAFLFLSPLLALLALAVRINLGGPVLFRQRRPGLHGKPFTLIKFRTMLASVDARGQLLSDEERITRFGRFLRATSLDELPELWNVIKGDMSLVGPRPLLLHYLDHYTPLQMRRHEVRPGITGWAQVNGRNAIGWDAKFAMDVWYVDNISFIRDMKILFLTLARVLVRSGISADGFATMPEFARQSPKESPPEKNE